MSDKSIVYKQIGNLSGISIVVGSIIGTGIFIAPSMVAKLSSSILVVGALWLLGALLCIIGADIYGKLGEKYPEGGGQYVYLKKCLGNKYSILYGWFSFLIICPSMIAGMSLYLGSQLQIFYPGITPFHIKLTAIAFVTLLTAINCFGIQVAGGFQKIIVIIQVSVILFLIAVSLIYLNAVDQSAAVAASTASSGGFSMSVALLAVVAILWSFEGFNSLTFVTNEVEQGKKNIRRLIYIGCAVVFVVYFLVNYCVLKFIPYNEILNTPNVAVSLSDLALGAKGKIIVFMLTVIGIITSTHISIIIGPRITKVLADDGFMFEPLKKIHPKFTSPNNALLVQLAFVLLYILIGNFEALITCFVIINWIFYCLVVFSFLKTRKVSVPGKLIPFKSSELIESVVFLALVMVIIAGEIYTHYKLSLIGLVIFGVGILVSDYVDKRSRKTKTATRLVAATATTSDSE